MSHCVNKSSIEFKKLQEKLGIKDSVGLAAEISLWQEENGIDQFPSKNDIILKGDIIPKYEKIKTDDSLKTWELGDYKGKPQSNEEQSKIDNVLIENPDEKVGGFDENNIQGESFNEFSKDRVIPALKKFISTSKNNTVILTHNSVFGMIKYINDNYISKGKDIPLELTKDDRIAYTKQDSHTADNFTVKTNEGLLHIVRHGETYDNKSDLNKTGNFRRDDISLTEKGVQQAISVGKKFENTDIPEIISSPLPRAINTSNLILDGNNSIKEKKPIPESKPSPVLSSKPNTAKELANELTKKDKYNKSYISRIDGSNNNLRIKKDWKAKGLEIIRNLQDRYPGVISWKTVNNEVRITIANQARLFSNEEVSDKIDKELRNKYFKNSQVTNSKSILDKIASSNHALNKLAEHLKQYTKHNNVTIVIKPVQYFLLKKELGDVSGNRGSAFYNPNTNTIHIAEFAPNSRGAEATILHEILHSLTHKQLHNNSETSKDLEELRKHASSLLGKEFDYATSNVDEFLVAIFTNSKFIKALMNTKEVSEVKKYNNLFDKIYNYILGLFKITPSSSLYDQAFANASHVLDEFMQLNDNLAPNEDDSLLFSKIDENNINNNINNKRPFKKQYTFFSRKIKELEKEIRDLGTTSGDQYKILKQEVLEAKYQLEQASLGNTEDEYVAMSEMHLDWVDDFIDKLPGMDQDKYTMSNIADALDILNAFNDLDDVKGRVGKLNKRLYKFIEAHNLSASINLYNTSGTEITKKTIDDQNTDIRSSAYYVGSLSDSSNIIARTIGSIIKAAQNRVSTINKKAEKVIQSEVDNLHEYAKNNGMTLQQVYDIFIQENKKGTLQLTQRYDKDGNINPNFTKISETKELNNFYKFYQDALKKAEANLPYKVGKHYILNIEKSTLKGDIKRIIPVSNVMINSFVSNEELLKDVVPDKYRSNIPAEKKSRDLGSGLMQFVAYANNHNELSSALPEVRLLQYQLKLKQDESGNLEERTFIKSSNPTKEVKVEDSNVYKMINTHIDMQLKDKMKDNKMKPINIGSIKNDKGDIVGHKQIHVEDVLDRLLRLNSLLRIGLSPITAISNVMFGEASNFIEAVGGRYYNVSEMNAAKRIFATQIDYISNKHDTNLYVALHRLNPLQELEDYEIGSDIAIKGSKLDAEKVMELMYSMQKKGELELQSTTMVAMLIHDGYMKTNGDFTEKWTSLTEHEATQLSDKIQRINQMIHGRYSQREAAAIQQSVWYRMLIQFRKWIPAAYESRFREHKYDNRLQTDVEGRYITLKNKVFKANSVKEAFENMFIPLFNSKKLLESGQMTETEIYNMRKNLVEMTLFLATALSMAAIKSGSDDDKKKKLKDPIIKAGLTLLNRTAGDLSFFYNPSNVGNLMKNAIPLGKLIGDVINVGMTLPNAFYLGDYEVKRGSLKGSNKFYSKALPKIVPGLSPVAQVQRVLNKEDVLPELGN